ncbi:unnamed protein product [Cyprideis torosa]|uniref:BACK domain-containing protein n=1 Tax=Cyprideis torosa TaxID=163714 RepID=A0A7R8ZL30_9CRUS|nr:unnamed protein product [Cyprideis torosa]CAG0890840.1 unnamed protein product [Cyprideis torosa]
MVLVCSTPWRSRKRVNVLGEKVNGEGEGEKVNGEGEGEKRKQNMARGLGKWRRERFSFLSPILRCFSRRHPPRIGGSTVENVIAPSIPLDGETEAGVKKENQVLGQEDARMSEPEVIVLVGGPEPTPIPANRSAIEKNPLLRAILLNDCSPVLPEVDPRAFKTILSWLEGSLDTRCSKWKKESLPDVLSTLRFAHAIGEFPLCRDILLFLSCQPRDSLILRALFQLKEKEEEPSPSPPLPEGDNDPPPTYHEAVFGKESQSKFQHSLCESFEQHLRKWDIQSLKDPEILHSFSRDLLQEILTRDYLKVDHEEDLLEVLELWLQDTTTRIPEVLGPLRFTPRYLLMSRSLFDSRGAQFLTLEEAECIRREMELGPENSEIPRELHPHLVIMGMKRNVVTPFSPTRTSPRKTPRPKSKNSARKVIRRACQRGIELFFVSLAPVFA